MNNKGNETSHGINHLLFLQKVYMDDLKGTTFCRNYCPYSDIRTQFISNDTKLRKLYDDISQIITTYNEACIEYENIQMYPDVIKNTDDMKYKMCLYKTQIQDIESYNIVQQTAYLSGLCLQYIAKTFVDKNTV